MDLIETESIIILIILKYEKNKIDAVVLILPTPIRSKYLKRLLKLKIPVISEKPLIDNYNDYKFLKRFKKNFVRVTYNYNGLPTCKRII